MLSKIYNPQSICVLRLSAIGDVCHAVAAVQAIQQRWPNAKITWIIGQVEARLLEGLPGVELVVFDKKAGLKSYFNLRAQLKKQHFDILLHMQVALRASLATLCIKATEKWGFDQSRAKEGQWLFTNRQIKPQNRPHVVDGFWGFAQSLGVDKTFQIKWKMSVSDADLHWQQQALATSGKYVVIVPAASKAERNWLPERYAAVADYIQSKGFSIVICGGPTSMEKKLATEIIKNCQQPLINLVGQTNLKQLLVVLKRAELVIAPDTGPTHMAVTVNTPVIGLYAHSNPKRTGPYSFQALVVSVYEDILQEQTGMSSQEQLWGKRVKGEHLMKRISVDQVIKAFERWFKLN